MSLLRTTSMATSPLAGHSRLIRWIRRDPSTGQARRAAAGRSVASPIATSSWRFSPLGEAAGPRAIGQADRTSAAQAAASSRRPCGVAPASRKHGGRAPDRERDIFLRVLGSSGKMLVIWIAAAPSRGRAPAWNGRRDADFGPVETDSGVRRISPVSWPISCLPGAVRPVTACHPTRASRRATGESGGDHAAEAFLQAFDLLSRRVIHRLRPGARWRGGLSGARTAPVAHSAAAVSISPNTPGARARARSDQDRHHATIFQSSPWPGRDTLHQFRQPLPPIRSSLADRRSTWSVNVPIPPSTTMTISSPRARPVHEGIGHIFGGAMPAARPTAPPPRRDREGGQGGSEDRKIHRATARSSLAHAHTRPTARAHDLGRPSHVSEGQHGSPDDV